MIDEHRSETFKTGEGRLTLAAAGVSLLALLGDAKAFNLDATDRKIVLVGLILQGCALTIARGLAKMGRPPRERPTRRRLEPPGPADQA